MRCVQPLALQSEAEPCCGLIPLCHTLHCDPSVSVTLPALQQEKGNGGASVKKKNKERHDLCLATTGFLSLGGTTEPHYMERIGFDLDPYCVVSQHQKKPVF